MHKGSSDTQTSRISPSAFVYPFRSAVDHAQPTYTPVRWMNSTMSGELDENYTESVGVRDRGRQQTGAQGQALSVLLPSHSCTSRPRRPASSGGTDPPQQGSSVRSSGRRTEFLLNSVSGAKEGRLIQASHQPQAPKQIHEIGKLQDRGNAYRSKSPPGRGLDDMSRFEGCVLRCANPPRPSKVFSVQMERLYLSIQRSSFRVVDGTTSIHKNIAPSREYLAGERHQICHLAHEQI